MRLGRNSAAITALLTVLVILPCPAQATHARFTHLSVGGGINNNGRAVAFLAATEDGAHVFFGSWENLTYDDRDNGANDIYEYANGTLRLISTSQYEPDGNSASASFGGISDDGERVFFSTSASLAPEDTDTDRDVYERTGDTAKLVSTGQFDSPGSHFADYEASSPDGNRVIFHTTERLIFEDDDAESDLYVRAFGRTELVTYADGEAQEHRSTAFVGASRDARTVVFDAAVPPVGGTWDSDMYVRGADGRTVALPGGSSSDFYTGPRFRGISTDGARVFYETYDALVPEDTDAWTDLYEFSDGFAKLLSQGPAGGNGRFAPMYKRASEDGSRVFFETAEQLVAQDTDTKTDVYERAGADTRLVSTGPNGGNGAEDATLKAVTPTGDVAYFETKEAITPEDQDSSYRDVYARSDGTTELVSGAARLYDDATLWWVSRDARTEVFSTGGRTYYIRTDGSAHPIVPAFGFANGPLLFKSATQQAERIVVESDDRLLASDEDNATDLYELGPGDPTRYPRPQGTAALRVPIVPAFRACTSPNTSHAQGTAWGTGGCNPPIAESRHVTVGTADFNGKPTRSQGVLTLGVVTGDAATAEDEADIDVGFRLTDVRNVDDLSDYTGQLQVSATIRLTDRSNGPAQEYAGTAQDLGLGFVVPCAATPGEEAGATCSINSRLRALRCCIPRLEGRRTVMKVDAIRVYDGGPDGIASTAADTDVFAWAGLFIP
jgi:hypothetical protein